MKKILLSILLVAGSLSPWIHAQTQNSSSETPPPATPASPPTAPAQVNPTESKPPLSGEKSAPVKEEKTTPVTDAEAKQAEEEARQKLLKEQALKEAAAKKAEEEAARKREEEKSAFTKFFENSKVYTGLTGSLGIPLNSLHGVGFGFGMSIDLMAYKRYGLHFGAETGQYPTKASTLSIDGVSYSLASGNTFGFLAIDLAAVYGLPKFLDLEPAVGLGAVLYRVSGGNYEFNTMIAPRAMASLYYNLISQLQVGLIWHLTLPSASKLQSGGTESTLDKSANLTVTGLQLSVRYAWF